MPTSTGDSATLEFHFRVQSSHPKISAAELVSDLTTEIPELASQLRQRYGDVSVEAEREKSIPIDWITAVLVIKVVAKAIATGALARLGADAYDYFKKRIKNGSIEPIPEETHGESKSPEVKK
jgi:hypothetical protein